MQHLWFDPDVILWISNELLSDAKSTSWMSRGLVSCIRKLWQTREIEGDMLENFQTVHCYYASFLLLHVSLPILHSSTVNAYN
jgi:hypothetical protein